MAVGTSQLLGLLTAQLAAFLEAVALNKDLTWLVMSALLSSGVVVFWSSRRSRSPQNDVHFHHLNWEQSTTPDNTLPQEKEQRGEAVTDHAQELDKQLLQLKIQLEGKNKVLDHLLQHLLPQALAIESLKIRAHELFDLVKSVQLAAHFSNQSMTDLPTDFEQNLQLKHPDLTDEDLRLCTYLSLHLSSLQIAQHRSISVAGVNKSRSRLRKKLGLNAEADLGLYLKGLQVK